MELNSCLGWQDSPSNRLASLREFRLAWQGKPFEDCVRATLKFYSNIPISSRCIDPFDENTWNSLWELVDNNEYCEFNRALLYGYTLHYLGWPGQILVGQGKNSQNMISVINNTVLNASYNESVDISWLDGFTVEKKVDTKQLCG